MRNEEREKTFQNVVVIKKRLRGNEGGGAGKSQIKGRIDTTPPPKINAGKMARLGLHTALSLI